MQIEVTESIPMGGDRRPPRPRGRNSLCRNVENRSIHILRAPRQAESNHSVGSTSDFTNVERHSTLTYAKDALPSRKSLHRQFNLRLGHSVRLRSAIVSLGTRCQAANGRIVF